MASKKENIGMCDDIISLAEKVKSNISTKLATGYMTVEIEKYLLDVKRMLEKVSEFHML